MVLEVCCRDCGMRDTLNTLLLSTEHCLPRAYVSYLDNLPHYSASSLRQKIGRALFVTMWAPALLVVIALGSIFSGKDGKTSKWAGMLRRHVQQLMFSNYEQVWYKVFGDGEASN